MSRSAPASGRPRCVLPVDLIIAALAGTNGLGIPHCDGDHDLPAAGPDPSYESVWLAGRGTL